MLSICYNSSVKSAKNIFILLLLSNIIGKKSLPLHKEDWKKFETNNKIIALNILYVPYKSKEIRHTFQNITPCLQTK